MSKDALTICFLLLVLGLTMPTIGKITIAVGATCIIARAAVSIAARSITRTVEA